MAVKISGTTVIDDSRVLSNITSLDSGTITTIQNSVGGTSNGEVVIVQYGTADALYTNNDYVPIGIYPSDVSSGKVNPYNVGRLSKATHNDYFVNVMDSQIVSDMSLLVRGGFANSQGVNLQGSPLDIVYVDENSADRYSKQYAYSDSVSKDCVFDRVILGVGGVLHETISPTYDFARPMRTYFADNRNMFVSVIEDKNESTGQYSYRWAEIGANSSNYTTVQYQSVSTGLGQAQAACSGYDGSGNDAHAIVGEGGIAVKFGSSFPSLFSQVTYNGQSVPFDTTPAASMNQITYVSYEVTTGAYTFMGIDYGYNDNTTKGNVYEIIWNGNLSINLAGTATFDGASDPNSFYSTLIGAYGYDMNRGKFIMSFNYPYTWQAYTSTNGVTWTSLSDFSGKGVSNFISDTNQTYLTAACSSVLWTSSDLSSATEVLSSLGSYGGTYTGYHDSTYGSGTENVGNGWIAYDTAVLSGGIVDYTVKLPYSSGGVANGSYLSLDAFSYDPVEKFFTDPLYSSLERTQKDPASANNNAWIPSTDLKSLRSFVKVK
jgi:hypothetical protein